MNEFLLVLTGGAVSLVTSAAVTWSLGRQAARGRDREVARESARQLTGLFIAARDARGAAVETLTEAEVVAVGITDRVVRERVRDVLRLLREHHLPEMEELSGVRSEQARRALCDHVLEVLGAHFRGERVPALPDPLRRMLDVENEVLGIRSGAGGAAGGQAVPVEADAADGGDASAPARKGRRKAGTTSRAGAAASGSPGASKDESDG
ncbi:hypothetical protein [Marinactinospora rubrisoli]|uniref:Secreted protein n=1 Tax=Marinactinospora rubrisoli TaxID=2715399 RepID=A0ABW2KHM4_9ACTN